MKQFDLLVVLGLFNGPTSRTQRVGQEQETFAIHIKVAVTHTRSGSDVNMIPIDFKREIIHKGLSFVQKLGRVTNARLEFNAGFSERLQIILNDVIAANVDFFLSCKSQYSKSIIDPTDIL